MALNKAYYLDYNSTSPLHKDVISALRSGDFLFSNASSQHSLGKKSSQKLSSVKKFLYNFFQIDQKYYNLFFHSGVTEAVNTFFEAESENVFMVSDHPCVKESAKKSTMTYEVPVLSDGHLDLEFLKNISFKSKNIKLNLTLVHNETGIIMRPDLICEIKSIYPYIKIHLDAAQYIGKTSVSLPEGFDMVSFSGHKFGALKGIGFSFIKNDTVYKPLIVGGGQQSGLRSGTINLDGIQSLYYALNKRDFPKEYREVLDLKNMILTVLKKNNNLIIIPNKSSNTICFMHKSKKSDEMLIHFDLHGLCVSAGSACSAGSFSKSETLIGMGFEQYADHNIRISLGHDLLKDQDSILEIFERIISKL